MYSESGDLSPLATCAESLKDLRLSTKTTVQDFAPLARLRRLEELMLLSDLTDLAFVRDLPELRSLRLGGLAHVADLSPLRAQARLESLGVDGCPALTDLRALPPLDRVTELSLERSHLGSGLPDLVERAPRIRDLQLTASAWAEDIGALGALPLQRLGLWNCRDGFRPARSDARADVSRP